MIRWNQATYSRMGTYLMYRDGKSCRGKRLPRSTTPRKLVEAASDSCSENGESEERKRITCCTFSIVQWHVDGLFGIMWMDVQICFSPKSFRVHVCPVCVLLRMYECVIRTCTHARSVSLLVNRIEFVTVLQF